MSYSAAYKNFKEMLKSNGLDARRFALHSPRIGGATDAFRNNIPPHIIDAQGRWKSSGTKFCYLRISDAERIEYFRKTISYI